MKNILLENLIKNILLVIILVPSYFWIKDSFQTGQFLMDKSLVGNLLVVVSIISMIACFGNFAFTYEKARMKNLIERLSAHIATGLFMLVIGWSLEMIGILAGLLIGAIPAFNLILITLYVASVLYDFWDLRRVEG